MSRRDATMADGFGLAATGQGEAFSRLGQRGGDTSYRLLLVAAVLVPLGILGLSAWLSWYDVWRQAEAEVVRSAEAISEYAGRLLDGHALLADRVDDLLDDLSEEEISAREATFHAALHRMAAARPSVLSLFAVGATGRPLVGADTFPIPPGVSAADRDFFTALRGADAPPRYVSKVHVSRLDGLPYFAISARRGAGADADERDDGAARDAGRFRGVVLATVSPDEVAATLRRLVHGNDESLALVRTDGEVLVRSLVGRRIPGAAAEVPPPPLHPQSTMMAIMARGEPSAVLRGRAAVDGVERIAAFRRVEGWPIYVSVSRSRAMIVRRWRDTVAWKAGVGLPAALALVGLTTFAFGRAREAVVARAMLQGEAERRATAEALAESEARLRLAQHAAGIGVFDWHMPGDEVIWNEEQERIFGLPRGSFSGKLDAMTHLLLPEDREKVEGAVAAATSRHATLLDFGFRIRRPDGEIRHIEASASFQYGADGTPLRMVGVNLDVTERRQTELALAESEARHAFLLQLSDMLQAMPEPQEVQAAACRMLGEHLAADRCYFGDIHGEEGYAVIRPGYAREGLPPIEGRAPLEDFADVVTLLQCGAPLAIADTETDAELPQRTRDAYRALGIRSFAVAPLLRARRVVWTMSLNAVAPRIWTRAEVALLEEVAARCWDAVERARASQALRASEARLAADLASLQELQRLSVELVGEHEPGHFYGQIVDVAARLMRADASSIQEFHADAGALSLLAWKGFHPDSAAFWERVVADTGSSCGRALARGARVVVHDTEEFDATAEEIAAFRRSGLRSAQSTPLLAQDGRIVGMLSTHWHTPHTPSEADYRHLDVLARLAADLIERLQVSQQLRASEAHLRSILETVPDALVLIDEQGIIESFSPRAEQLFRWPAEEALGRNVSVLMPGPERDLHDGHLGRYLATNERRIIGIGRALTGLRRDGSTFPMELAVGELHVAGQRHFTGFIRDITERRATQARLQELHAELLHVSRLSEAGAMASALAHELNQPFTSVTSAVRAAQRMLASGDPAAKARVREALDLAAEQALRAGQIIQRLREFVSRGEADQRLEDLPRLIEEAGGLALVGARQQGIQVHYDFDESLPQVLVDRVQIQQVVFNLLRNAVQAMAEQPAPADGAPDRAATLSVSARLTERGDVEVSVADTGPGLAPEIAGRLFEPFVTSKPGGMGVGLSISRTIVEAHGGQLWAEPNPGGGTVFRFTLPAAPGGV